MRRAAVAAINSNVVDMAQWVRLQLGNGGYQNGGGCPPQDGLYAAVEPTTLKRFDKPFAVAVRRAKIGGNVDGRAEAAWKEISSSEANGESRPPLAPPPFI